MINPIKDTVDTLYIHSELIKLIKNSTNDAEFTIHDVAKNMYIPEFKKIENTDIATKKNLIFQEIMKKIKDELAQIRAADIF